MPLTPDAHQPDPEQDRADGAEHQVRDGLRDREVERAEVDRHPLVLLELGRRVEVAARERARRREQRDGRGEDESAAERQLVPAFGPV